MRQGLLFLVFVLVTGILSYMLLCGWSLGDALYMVVITISTVGYGEIGPRSVLDRYVTSYIIIFGITSSGYALAGAFQLLSEGQLRRVIGGQMHNAAIAELANHHIVCGYGRMGSMICETLIRDHIPFVVIESDLSRSKKAENDGVLYVEGDATDEHVLERAGIRRAKSLICVLSSDADNVFVTLTGREMNDSLFILARAEKLTTEKKLQQAGADRVVSPQLIGAARICSLLTRPTTVEILELVAGRQIADLEMNELDITTTSPLAGRSLAETRVRDATGCMIVAIKRHSGELLVNPASSVLVQSGDTVVVLGRREDVDEFRRRYRA